MKTFVLLGLLAACDFARADSIGIMDCGDEKLSISLVRYPGSRTQNAQITEGSETDTDYVVRKRPRTPGRMGAPVIYQGKGFELRVSVGTRKTAGQTRSHIRAKTSSGAILDQDILCLVY